MHQKTSEVARHCEKAYLTVEFLHSSLADLSSARVGTAFGVCLWDKDSLDLRPGFACMYSPLCLEIIAQTVRTRTAQVVPASVQNSLRNIAVCLLQHLPRFPRFLRVPAHVQGCSVPIDLEQLSALYKAGKVTSSQARCKAVLPCAYCTSGILSCNTPKI